VLVTFAFANSFVNHPHLLPNILVSFAFYVGETIITLCFFSNMIFLIMKFHDCSNTWQFGWVMISLFLAMTQILRVHVNKVSDDTLLEGWYVWGIKLRKRKRPLNSKLTLGQPNMVVTILEPFVDLLVESMAPTLKHHQWLTHQCWIDVYLTHLCTWNQWLFDEHIWIELMTINLPYQHWIIIYELLVHC
jgi:hypothetical protein